MSTTTPLQTLLRSLAENPMLVKELEQVAYHLSESRRHLRDAEHPEGVCFTGHITPEVIERWRQDANDSQNYAEYLLTSLVPRVERVLK